MSQLNQYVPYAQVIGLSGASALSAYIASFSFIGIPACEMAPIDLMARQWSTIYHIGASSVPPMAITISTCFAFVAYQSCNIASASLVSPVRLYTAAALLPPTIVAYTFTVMWDGVQALEAKAAGKANAPSETETMSLLRTWSWQNLHRSMIVGTSAVLSAVAMLS